MRRPTGSSSGRRTIAMPRWSWWLWIASVCAVAVANGDFLHQPREHPTGTSEGLSIFKIGSREELDAILTEQSDENEECLVIGIAYHETCPDSMEFLWKFQYALEELRLFVAKQIKEREERSSAVILSSWMFLKKKKQPLPKQEVFKILWRPCLHVRVRLRASLSAVGGSFWVFFRRN